MRSTDEISSKQSADRYQLLCLLEKMPKGVFTFIRLFMLLLGFSTICLGALCISTTTSTCRCGNNKLVFYCLLALGFFLLVTGIFWSTSHEVLKQRGRSSIFVQNLSRRELRVSTIDRYVLQTAAHDQGRREAVLWADGNSIRFLQNKNYVTILIYFCGENCSLKYDLLEQAAIRKQQSVQKIHKVRCTTGNMAGCKERSNTMHGGGRCSSADSALLVLSQQKTPDMLLWDTCSYYLLPLSQLLLRTLLTFSCVIVLTISKWGLNLLERMFLKPTGTRPDKSLRQGHWIQIAFPGLLWKPHTKHRQWEL